MALLCPILVESLGHHQLVLRPQCIPSGLSQATAWFWEDDQQLKSAFVQQL